MITNIQVLIEPDDKSFRIAQAAREEQLIKQHRRGEHPWGAMRRDCPLCQK